MSHPTPERSKIACLEGLRGVMAWWVVLGHLSLALGLHLPVIDDNVLAVDVFILLSGFVIMLLLDRKREAYPAYITRRAFRIFPLYLVVLFVSTALLTVQLDAWQGIPFPSPVNAGREHLAAAALQALPAHLAAHLPLAQGLVPTSMLEGAPWTIVGQAWSVSLEWQFYLVAPLFVWCFSGSARWKGTALALVVMTVLWLAGRGMTPAFLGCRIWHFGLGMVTYFWTSQPARRHHFGLLALLFGLLILWTGGARQALPLAIWGSVLGSMASPPASWRHFLASVLGRAPFLKLGEVSYSVYLTHMVPLVVGIWGLNRLALGDLGYRLILSAFVIVATLVLSRMTYRFLEAPGIALGARLTEARRIPSQA